MRSIHLRLLLMATLVLAGFLGITGWALDSAFRKSSEAALREKLQSHVYGLLAAADVDARGRMQLPENLPSHGFPGRIRACMPLSAPQTESCSGVPAHHWD